MEEEIDLRELLQTLWDGRWLIAGLTAAAVLVSGLLSYFVLPPTYESKAIVAVQAAEMPEIPGGESPLVGILGQQTIGVAEAVAVFQQRLDTRTLAQEAAAALQLPAEEFASGSLPSLVSVTAQEDSNQVVITARQETSERAKALADWAANQFRQQVNTINLNVILSRLTTLSAQLDAQIASSEKQIAALEQQLREIPRTIELQESIVDNPLLQQGEARRSGSDLEETAGLTAVRQEVNPTYEIYRQRLDNERAGLAQAVALRDQVEAMFADEASLKELADRSGTQALVVAAANRPVEPVAPRKLLNMAVAGVLGGMLSVFLVFFLQFLRGGAGAATPAGTATSGGVATAAGGAVTSAGGSLTSTEAPARPPS